MTGKELLFEELRSRGLTESQIKSKAVAVLLDVIANDGTERYLNAKEVDDELKEKREALASLQNSLKIRKWQNEEVIESLRHRSDNLERNIKAMRAEFNEYVAEYGNSRFRRVPFCRRASENDLGRIGAGIMGGGRQRWVITKSSPALSLFRKRSRS